MHSMENGNNGFVLSEELTALREQVMRSYEEKTDIRYAAARLWVDRVIQPEETRTALVTALEIPRRTPTTQTSQPCMLPV